MLREAYESVRTGLDRAGIAFEATRHSAMIAKRSDRDDPALFNRAQWRPFVTDDKYSALYKRAQQITGSEDNLMKQGRFYSTFQMADYAARLPDGDVVECGCWRGHSTYAISTILAEHGFTGRFDVFDAFEGGLSDFTAKDESAFQLSGKEKDYYVGSFEWSMDAVRQVTEPFGFVHLHKGWIPDVFAGFEPGPLRFVNIDVDMYEPTKAALTFLWPHLVPGGCVVVDDYNYTMFEGATNAVEEFLDETPPPTLVYRVPFGGSIIMIK